MVYWWLLVFKPEKETQISLSRQLMSVVLFAKFVMYLLSWYLLIDTVSQNQITSSLSQPVFVVFSPGATGLEARAGTLGAEGAAALGKGEPFFFDSFPLSTSLLCCFSVFFLLFFLLLCFFAFLFFLFLCIFAFLLFCFSVFCSLLCIFLCFRSFVFRPASLLFCLITSAATTTWRTAPAAQTTRTSNTKGRTRTTKTIKTTGTTRTTRETRETRTTTTAKEEHNRSCLCVPWGGRSAPLFLFWTKPYQGICMSIEHNLNMLSRLKRDIEIIEVCTICRLGSALTGYLADRAGGIIRSVFYTGSQSSRVCRIHGPQENLGNHKWGPFANNAWEYTYYTCIFGYINWWKGSLLTCITRCPAMQVGELEIGQVKSHFRIPLNGVAPTPR